MPTPLRRSGSGLLQNPRPGLLPSPHPTGLGPLGPSPDFLSTRHGSVSLRPSALFPLPSAPPLSGYRRFPYRAPLAACPGPDFHRLVIQPLLGGTGGAESPSELSSDLQDPLRSAVVHAPLRHLR